MAEELVRRIQREVAERIQELRGAVEEHDRLQADLKKLQGGSKRASVRGISSRRRERCKSATR